MTERLPESYQQITDIIHILRRVHEEMSNLCKAAGATQGETKVGLLLASLAERQQHMVEFFDTSKNAADEKVLATWIQFVPSERVQQRLELMQATETTPNDLPKQVLEVQQDIAELVSVIQDEPASEDVKQFVQALADRESAEAKLSSETVLGADDV